MAKLDTARFLAVSSMLAVSEIELRVMRACKTVRSLPDRDVRFLRNVQPTSVQLQIVYEFLDAYSPDNVIPIRFRPTPFDVSDMLIALGWCKCLTKQEFRYLWWRSFDNVSFKTVAARIGRSDETARSRYRDALLKVWYVANSQQ